MPVVVSLSLDPSAWRGTSPWAQWAMWVLYPHLLNSILQSYLGKVIWVEDMQKAVYIWKTNDVVDCYVIWAAEANGLCFVCFVVINPRVLSTNELFYFIDFPILPPKECVSRSRRTQRHPCGWTAGSTQCGANEQSPPRPLLWWKCELGFLLF